MTGGENQEYNRVARHFDVQVLPRLLSNHLPDGPLALADVGSGDGPLFMILQRMGYISPSKPVYAVDLQVERLECLARRVPFITTVNSSADVVSPIPDGALDFVISTMVMEHVVDEARYLDELKRLLKPGGKAYITTVFKRRWAWYFRRRDGESVLDVSHVREYTDLEGVRTLVLEGGRFSAIEALEIAQLWFPVIDPLLFRLVRGGEGPLISWLLFFARFIKVPIPGYYTLSIVVRR
jgi:ubiquinone/menaquinone biosynthesis C-methylase UbiE